MADASVALLPPPVPQVLPTELERVVRLVDAKPEALARGDAEMYTAALAASRMIYELSLETEKSAVKPISKLLSGLSPDVEAPTTRAQKRKRDDTFKPPTLSFKPTPKAGLWNSSLGAAKLWERMEHRTGPLCGILDAVVTPEVVIEEEEEEGEELDETIQEDEDSEAEFVADDDEMDYSMSDEDEDDDSDEEEDEDEEIISDGDSHLGDTTMELSRGEDDSEPSESEDGNEEPISEGGYLDGLDLDREENPERAAKRRAHPTLDDDFFSIDAFNRETEALEAHSRSSGALNDEDESEDEDVDMFATVNDIEDDQDDVNDPKYKDFFAPPLKSKKPVKPVKAQPRRKVKLLVASPPKRQTRVRFSEEVRVRNVKSRRTRASLLAELAEEGDEIVLTNPAMMFEGKDADDGEGDVESEDEEESGSGESEGEEEDSEGEGTDDGAEKGDLFADDEAMDEDGAPMSSYQKRQAELAAEIKALEAENVATKPWMLQGEATARSRPQNALLAADLEFEHIGKVVPVVTEESVKKLEDRIKARIIEGRYDDVVRKREVDPKPFLPSRTFELKDTQSEKSLAQIYEEEYTAARAGPSAAPIDDRDGKLAQEHKEIEELWDGICYKLDALSNAHFTPKQPKAQITTVSNMASASLESALPTSLSTSTLLAPEEVFAPSSSDTRARGELTPTEKRAVRSKERKKRRKQRDALSGAVDKFAGQNKPRSVKEAKNQVMNSLVKSGKGVTVIGKGDKKGKNGVKPGKEDTVVRDSKKLKL
ncbi:U3 small nucleolar ribonucleoprotein mpp10 [Ceratobasidium sp. AG-Ba]|nr:U3 small nucleolar ribonucleoprotein mpp10 [Ceratobasidium sp. AG-Ba]